MAAADEGPRRLGSPELGDEALLDEPHGDEADEVPDEGEGGVHEEVVPEQGVQAQPVGGPRAQVGLG